MSQPADPYAILGIAHFADAATIRAAYKLRALEHHPDRPGGSTVRMQEITSAYGILADVTNRAAWDRGVASSPHAERTGQWRPFHPATRPTPSATPGGAWSHAPESRAGAAEARPLPTKPTATAASRIFQWSAVAVVLSVVQEMTIGGVDVVLAAAATVLAVRVFVCCWSGREPFWPARDARGVVRGFHALAVASFRQRSAAR